MEDGEKWKNVGKSYFGDAVDGFLPHWLEGGRVEMLNAGIFTGMASQVIHQLKQLAPSEHGFWQLFNSVSNVTNNLPAQILYGIANDAYIFGKSYSQGQSGVYY